jgi:hypothetical protein
LKKWFGPSQEEIWTQLVAEINQEKPNMQAEFVDGGTWKGDLVRVHVGEWTVTLDTMTVTTMAGKVPITMSFTRFRAPFVNADGFRFNVSRKSIFSGLGKMFGMQDVEVGDTFFDEEFIIQGTEEGKLRALFANEKIRQLIHAQPNVHFEVKNDEGWFNTTFPEGVDELYFQASSVITDLNALKQLFDLFAETLNQLCVIGSAYEKDPQVTL